MRAVVKGLLAVMGLILVYAGVGLPEFGDVHAPAGEHVGAYYTEHAYHHAHTPNIVTVMIADYRSFDTLGETVVVFAAGIACFFLLRGMPRTRRPDREERVSPAGEDAS